LCEMVDVQIRSAELQDEGSAWFVVLVLSVVGK
jgi:hypothetical protein